MTQPTPRSEDLMTEPHDIEGLEATLKAMTEPQPGLGNADWTKAYVTTFGPTIMSFLLNQARRAGELEALSLALMRAVEDVRDDQTSQSMNFGRTAEERKDRQRQLAAYIAQNAAKVDDALEALSAALQQEKTQ